MFFPRSRISKKMSILIALLSIVILVSLMILYVRYPEKWLMVLVIIMSVVFVLSMNLMISKIAVFKMKPIKYPKGFYKGQTFNSLEDKLVTSGFKVNPKKIGAGFIKIEGKTAYKVILIRNADQYFNQEDDKQAPTKGIDKCTEFIGFEFFYDVTEETIKRLPDFSFKGNNVFYEGFYYDPEFDVIVEANKIDADSHDESYRHLKDILALSECENPYPEENSKKSQKNKKIKMDLQ